MVGVVSLKPKSDNTYCDYPFKQLALKNWNKQKLLEYSPCCMMHTSGDNKMNLQESDTKTPIQAFYSEEFVKLRKDLSSNIRHEACETCWKIEDKGLESARLYSQEYDIESETRLRQLDITLSNKCNLMCRMCNFGNSHKFKKEIEYFKKNNLLDKTQYATSNYYPEQTYMPNSSESNQLNWLRNNTDKIKVLKASGGEPFYDDQIIELLNIYIYSNHARDTILEFDTNGTMFNDEILKINNEFKLLNHSISIDGIEEVYEYIRYPHTFSKLDNSLRKYLMLNNIHCVHYAFVLSSLNIFNVKDYLFYIASVSRHKDFYINFEKVRPFDRGTSINLLPIDILEEAKTEILASDFFEYYDLSICKNLLSSIDDAILNNQADKEKLSLEINLLDKARNQNFVNHLDQRISKWIM